ncbi:MAG: DinB family protein [Ferruginibacter sp.]
MELIQVTDSRIYSLIVLYDLHTGFFSRAIDGISEDDAHNRMNTKANHTAWLTGSLVEQRFEIAKGVGIDKTQAAHEHFKDNKGIQDNTRYPLLQDFKTDWETISPLLRTALIGANEEKLNKEIDMGGHKMTFFELLSFLVYREANIIGQIALWRRLLGYDAMKYM